MDNSTSTPTAAKAADRILFLIKTKGPASAAAIAQSLGVTAEAARQQLHKLVLEGLVEGRQEIAAGAGRPRQAWGLTSAGFQRFPDTHAQLAVQLIDGIRQAFGVEGLEQLIVQRESETLASYLSACQNAKDLKARVQMLAELRTAEGYMARVEADSNDLLLVEDHCPICAAASACQGFCRSELQIFQEVIGLGASVQRVEHLQSGGRRCVYRITPA